jgi:hypothetical protein
MEVMSPLSEPLQSLRDPLQALDDLVAWSVVGQASMSHQGLDSCSPSN